jgi:hypothetical protein
MNQIIHPDGVSQVPWPANGHQTGLPEKSTLSGGEKTTPAAMGLLEQAVQSAHGTIDHLADGVAPAVQQLDARAAAVKDALHATSDQLVAKRDMWVESIRKPVRDSPLVAVISALALGFLVARITS